MIITTTPSIEGKNITEYKGVVFGEVVEGINVLKDMGAGLKNVLGGRSEGYENSIREARNTALEELAARAEEMGANAVVGIDYEYEILGTANNMLMVSVSGTAVVTD